MTADIHQHRILILDFGSQYTQLIARRVREAGVYSEIYAWDITEADIRAFNPSGIVLSGGPESVTEPNSPRAPEVVFELDVPVLGICYGMQTMAVQMGGEVQGSETSEFGYAQIRRSAEGGLLQDISDHQDDSGQALLDVWMSHGDKVVTLPPNFNRIAETDSCPIAGMAHSSKPWFGIQFHPEVTHTSQGERIFEHFVLDICGCEALWTPANIVEDAIQKRVRTRWAAIGCCWACRVVSILLLWRHCCIVLLAISLTCVFVDNGLLRLDEGDQVMAMFAQEHGCSCYSR